MNDKKKRLILRVILGISLLLVGIAILVPLLIRWHYEQVIERKLPDWVAKGSDSLYHLTVEDIELNIFSKKLRLKNLRLSPDSSRLQVLRQQAMLPAKIYNISIPILEVEGIEWATILTDRELNCKSFHLLQPVIHVEKSPTSLSGKKDHRPKNAKNEVPKFNIQSLDIVEPDITFQNSDRTDSLSFYLKGGRISINECAYDPSKSVDVMQMFRAKSGTLKFDSLVLRRQNSLYAVKTDNISFASTDNSFEVRNLNITPALSRDAYYKEIGEQDEILTMKCPLLKMTGTNWEQLIENEALHVASLLLSKPSIDVYISRIPKPAEKKIRKLPGQMLNTLSMPLNIDKMEIQDGRVSYTELNEKTKQEGTLPFEHLEATITNITNIDAKRQLNSKCVAKVKAQFVGSIIGLDVNFDLKDSSGGFSSTGYQTSMDGTRLNDITRPLAQMEMKSLQMNKMEFSLTCNGQTGTGDFLFLYNDFNLKILNVEEDGTLASKGLISFVVNKALLYPDNPMVGEPIRKAHVTFQRDTHKSFFNFLWTAVRTGALLTAGRNSKVADIITNRKKAKESQEEKDANGD